MDFEKSMSFNLPPVAVDAEALHAIAAVLSKSGPCKFWHYQDAFDSLDALLAGRQLPLDRIDLDAPAATVSIYRSGVAIQHLADAHDLVRDLEATILKSEIPSLARMAKFCRFALLGALVMALIRNSFEVVMVISVVGMLLDHTVRDLVVKSPVVKLPPGMHVNTRLEIVAGVTVVMLVLAFKIFLVQNE